MNSNNPILHNLKKQIDYRLEAKFPEFHKSWKSIVKEYGNDFVDIVRDNFQKEFEKLDDFSSLILTIVIDNNLIFGQIKNLLIILTHKSEYLPLGLHFR